MSNVLLQYHSNQLKNDDFCLHCKSFTKLVDKLCAKCDDSVKMKYVGNITKQKNVCQNCNESAENIFCCKMVNKCTFNRQFCLKCSVDHESVTCENINRCFECKLFTTQFYQCAKSNKCYQHLSNNGFIFCKECSKNHQNELCDIFNTCVSCNKNNVTSDCQKQFKCSYQHIFCDDCSGNHQNTNCNKINHCQQCLQSLNSNNMSQKNIFGNEYLCKLCANVSEQNKNVYFTRCSLCFGYTNNPQACNLQNSCDDTKKFCFTCSHLIHGDKCFLNNTCVKCNRIGVLKKCNKKNKCNSNFSYCVNCIADHENSECQQINTCVLCEKPATGECQKTNKCQMFSYVFCDDHQNVYHSNYCTQINTCFQCKNDQVPLFPCQMTAKCTNEKLFCEKCANSHENGLCKLLNTCQKCGNKNDQNYKYCQNCDYNIRHRCSECNEFNFNTKQTKLKKETQQCKKCKNVKLVQSCFSCKTAVENQGKTLTICGNSDYQVHFCNKCFSSVSNIQIAQQMIQIQDSCMKCCKKDSFPLCTQCEKEYEQFSITNVLQSDLENEVCSICQEFDGEFIVLQNCKQHHFHEQCLSMWIKSKKHQTHDINGQLIDDPNHVNTYFPCPICQQEYETSMLHKKIDKQAIRMLALSNNQKTIPKEQKKNNNNHNHNIQNQNFEINIGGSLQNNIRALQQLIPQQLFNYLIN